MRNIFLFYFLLAAVPLALSQKAKKGETPERADMETAPAAIGADSTVYKLALRYGDVNAAIVALYYQIANNPGNLTFLDSLATLYFSTSQFVQCIGTSQELLSLKADNLRALRMLAYSQKAVGLAPRAIETFQILLANTQELAYAYELLILQFSLQRFGECRLTAQQILNHAEIDNKTVDFVFQNDPENSGQNRSQQVSLKAAVHNVLGLVAKELNEPDTARTNFQKALEIAPDFIVAKNNLAALDKTK